MVAVATAAAGGAAPPADAQQHAIVSNGTIQLGVWSTAQLNVPGGAPSLGGTRVVGLRYLPTGAEATAPGCLCEGWGAADAASGVTGYANEAADGGAVNLDLISFSADAETATSVVDIDGSLRVTHAYRPSPRTPNLYQADVTIENRGSDLADVRYRRVMDWDVEPTAFSEYVTIDPGTATDLAFDSNDGFATANPLGPRTNIGATGAFVDRGPLDHGALFDFDFGFVEAGDARSFRIYYGAAATEAEALDALAAVRAEVYSLGQPSTADGPTLGTPNTFVFAFGGVGGDPVVVRNSPPVAVLAATPESGRHPVEVSFDGSDSFDPDGDLAAWSLDFGDASEPASGTGPPPAALAHVYTRPGSYTATLTVGDDDGEESTESVRIRVLRAGAELTARPVVAEVLPGAEVVFPRLSATLRRTAPSGALAGRELRFYAGGELLCTATTGSDGTATCESVETSLRTVPSTGYEVVFGGDDDHMPTSRTAGLVRVDGSDLP